MKKIMILVALVVGMLSCGKKDINIKAYYFPYTNFTTPSTYKYVDVNDSSKVLYWNFNSTIKNGDTIFATAVYNKELVVNSVFISHILENSVELHEMYVNPTNSDSLYKCEIKSGEIFNWKLNPQKPLFVSYALSNTDKTRTEETVTERIFQTKQEMVTYSGKDYSCLVVKENTLINHIQETRTKTEEQERTSYFAPGIGLIKFETSYADGSVKTFSLQQILTNDEWGLLLKNNQQQDTISK